MADRSKLSESAVSSWVSAHSQWKLENEKIIARTWKFADFGSALAFVVRASMIAERRNHHPDVELGWGKAVIRFTTHDAGGLTQLDLDTATEVEGIAT